jgi:myo-inositol 2-dehydrogenase/D-chiro-inositol 1-dehydrogenase
VENKQHNRNILFNESGIHESLPLDFFMDRYANSYMNEMKIFIDTLVNDTPVAVGVDDAVEASRIAVGAKISMEEGRPVRLDEIGMIKPENKFSLSLNM